MLLCFSFYVWYFAEDDTPENEVKKVKVKKPRLKLRVYSQKDAVGSEELSFVTDGSILVLFVSEKAFISIFRKLSLLECAIECIQISFQ